MDDVAVALAYECGVDHGLDMAFKKTVLSDQTIRLHAGELTGSEMRAVKAVITWIGAEIKGLKS